ncbi:MAG: hypothetical protein Ct9H300mP20_14420 [Gammaproteobacteria bacterium]|nr:MAG: hypothetical protein Ct9H300mP20_14420 [Gammaproteobacteria bacterium]
MALDFPNRKHYLDWRYKSLVAKSYENCEEDEETGSYDCYVKADTSQELFRKLEKLDSDLLVIPHGSPLGSDFSALIFLGRSTYFQLLIILL